MKKRVEDILKYYCELEKEDFINSSIFSTLNELANSQELNLEIDFGRAIDKKDKSLYLSLSVHDKNGELIEIFDEGYLITSTMLVLVDKKERYKFFSWSDDEFIDDLNWIITQIKKHF